MNRFFLFLIFVTVISINVLGQSLVDPGRVTLYNIVTRTSNTSLRLQNDIILSNTSGHTTNALIMSKENKLLKEYDKYLKSMGNVLAMAANIYGLYYECDRCVKLMSETSHISSNNPKNVVATALHPLRSETFKDVMEAGPKIVADLENLLPKRVKNGKTVWNYGDFGDRLNALQTTRRDIRTLNRSLMRLNRILKYTSLLDTWYAYIGKNNGYRTRSIEEITNECRNSWANNARMNGLFSKGLEK